ncbi:MAG: BrnT family toxin [Elusimicrobia bacterium]|nr:BrnT family toxin [Elusimicrobiota bacterium]
MDFIWDVKKDEANVAKHGISFKIAITAFDDPFQLRAPDLKHSSPSEKREWLIGEADVGVLVIIFTIRQPGNIFRIISARKANRRERRQYEQNKGISI